MIQEDFSMRVKKMDISGRLTNQRGSSTLVVLLLLLILGVLLIATNPDEAKMRSEISAEFSSVEEMGDLAVRLNELLGTLEVEYNDYFFCSTLFVGEAGEEKKMLAVGVAGQVFTEGRLDNIKETVEKKIRQWTK